MGRSRLAGYLLAPPAQGGNNNPDGITETATTLISSDYTTEDASQVLSQPNIALMDWDASYGYGGTPGWRANPDPINGSGENEDTAGWNWPGSGASPFTVDAHNFITISFMLKFTTALLDEIMLHGLFWNSVNKFLDFKYWNAAGNGAGNRNGVHFGLQSPVALVPRFVICSGGAGPYFVGSPDWRTFGDEWMWLCFLIDMRGATSAERHIATYYKRSGDSGVTRSGRTFENEGLTAYEGRGIWGSFSQLCGYWDDMRGRDSLVGTLAEMHVSLDRLRIMPGWPDAANGPPF